ncbi:MAG: hypothetical protein IPM04_14435 [Saprospiraceae bacterium]|nr:hypothetical protein [Candidatus Brachybacter algidus]MBK8748978.1 hypothetical protein [Candidatus Brachybacter algidus]
MNKKGTIWYDDIALIHLLSRKNILSGGDFEVETDKIDIQLDFTRFNEAGRKYFDDYGFTGYNLRLKGLGVALIMNVETANLKALNRDLLNTIN